MTSSLDIHRVAFITRSAKHLSDTRWLIAYFLNQDGVHRNAPPLRQHPSRVAGGLLNWDGSSAGTRAPDMGLNDEYQLVDESRAHASRDSDTDLESGSILSGGVVGPSLIQDELVRSQDPFDGVDQSVPIHEPVYLGPQQPALSQILRRGGVPVAEQEDREQIDMSSIRHGASSLAQVGHFSIGTQLSRPTSCPILLSPHADLVSPAVEMLSSKEHVDEALR
jgi:hypothetical protein